ncbi:MAG: penicillin acylase family protein [Cyanobacteria bacterium P01_F01_bin.116]
MVTGFVVFVIIPVTALCFWLFSYLQSSVADANGQYVVEGISNPVNISRDKNGTVYIDATTDEDAYFAIGFSHAQDRLWQLELQRRMVRGELSEVFGKSTLPFDIFVRTLGLHKSAQESWKALDESAQKSLSAYARGVNAWVDSAPHLPSEFLLLDIEPEHWSTADSLAWVKMFALNMGLNYRRELDNLLLSDLLPAEKLVALTGVESEPLEVANLHTLVSLLAVAQQMETDFRLTGSAIGSNAWAVAPALTASGNAVLANDPHVGLELPSGWYALQAKGDRLDVAGMSLVGLPLVILGRNNAIAWGGTNMMADAQDLFVEQINPLDRNRYLHDEQWLPLQVDKQLIQVKADFPAILREPLKPVSIEVRRTVNGPLVSDISGETELPLALKWTGMDSQDTSYQAFFDLNYATDWESFRRALAQHVAPAMNMVYADKDKNIGYLGIGDIPVRGKGQGNFPVQGWLPELGWQGRIPEAEMPYRFNPESGFIVAANQNMLPDDYPYFVSDDWAPDARARRVVELLQSAAEQPDKIGFLQHQRIQLDQTDKLALEFLPHLKSAIPQSSEQELLLSLLEGWDGNTGPNSIQSSIFFLWLHHLKNLLFDDDLRTEWGNLELSARLQQVVADLPIQDILRALLADDVNWCDSASTPEQESCEQQKLQALTMAHNDLVLLLGSNSDNWQWEEIHQTLFVHRPFSSVRGLDVIYERQIPSGGSANSINVSGATFDRNSGFTQSYGAAFRQIVEFSETGPEQHVYSNSTGQSGDVFSRHYDDMLKSYAEGRYFYFQPPANPQVMTLLPESETQRARDSKL